MRRPRLDSSIRAAAVILAVLATAAPVHAQTPPPLPHVALEAFPPAAREAVSRAYRAATDRPADAAATGALGRVLQAWEQWEAAHAAYARAQELAPAAFEWHYLDAVVLQRLARHQEAVDRLRAALAGDPDYLPARVRLAEALLEAGTHQESERLFEALTKEREAEPAAHVGLGRIAAAQGRHEQALRHFGRAVELFPELGAAHYGMARAHRALGRMPEAERALAAHVKFGARWPRLADPLLDGVAAERDDARRELQRGTSLAEAGDFEGAVAAHLAALERDPALGQAHANLVSLYGRLKNWTEAERHYRKAIALEIGGADVHYDYGLVLGHQGQWRAAAEAYRTALAANPLHAPARNNLGQALERLRDLDGAAAEYRRALEAQPTFRLARFNLGRMLLAQRQPVAAAAEFEQIVDPPDAEAPRYLFGLATAYVQSGRKAEGAAAAVRARALALEHGDLDLAAAIERELATLK